MSPISDAISDLLETTSSGAQMVKKYGPDWTKWPATSKWFRALSLLSPPPVPPPPSSGFSLGIYLDPEGNPSSYSTEFDNAKAAIPGLDFAMAPMDVSVISHVGFKGQWVLIPAGCTQARFQQYGVPCWQTGLVAGFIVVDEPGSDSASLALVKEIAGWVNTYCTGTNLLANLVLTAVTQFDPGTLTALANSGLVDVLFVDNYPARPAWNMATWNACVAAVDAAWSANKIEEYGLVLDAFEAPNYPAPTAAQLQQQVTAALATDAEWLVVYAWGQAGGTPLAQLPGLIPVLNTIKGA